MVSLGPYHVSLAIVTLMIAELALMASFYHQWWWYDVVMHAVVSAILAVWGHALEVPSRWAWPLFVAGMLAWEWLELATYLYSPSRFDVLKDLTVNLVAFGTVWGAVSLGYAEDILVPHARTRLDT